MAKTITMKIRLPVIDDLNLPPDAIEELTDIRDKLYDLIKAHNKFIEKYGIESEESIKNGYPMDYHWDLEIVAEQGTDLLGKIEDFTKEFEYLHYDNNLIYSIRFGELSATLDSFKSKVKLIKNIIRKFEERFPIKNQVSKIKPLLRYPDNSHIMLSKTRRNTITI